MLSWIIAAGILVVVTVVWRLLRGLWKESHAHVDGLPPAKVRRAWPMPSDAGQRVMWCPLLANKVILTDTQLDEGDIGTVVGFSGVEFQPVISFDARPTHKNFVDKWGAARVLPVEFEQARPRTPPPTGRTTPKKKGP